MVDSNLLFLMSEYLTHMPLRIDPTLTANMNVQSAASSYEERVREVEHASFSPLVFSTSGGMGASTTVAYKRLAFLLSAKWKTPYSRVMSWLRCRLGFSLLHSAIMCIRGSRSSSGRPLRGHVPASIDLALEEGRLGAG